MADTKFKPWQSWNPKGKPPWTRNVETLFRDALKKLAEESNIEDIERDLVKWLLDKAKKGDMKALEMYLDRLYGKPKQTIESNVKLESTTSALEDLEKLTKPQDTG